MRSFLHREMMFTGKIRITPTRRWAAQEAISFEIGRQFVSGVACYAFHSKHEMLVKLAPVNGRGECTDFGGRLRMSVLHRGIRIHCLTTIPKKV